MLQKIKLVLELVGLAFHIELKRILKDPGAMLVLFGALLIYPVIYSVAYQNEVLRDVPIAVVDLDHSKMSRKVRFMLDATQQLETSVICSCMEEARRLFWDGDVKGVIMIPRNFEVDIFKGNQTNVGVYCDASYFLMYKETLTGALGSVGTLAAGLEIRRLMSQGKPMEQAMIERDPLPLNIHTLYNPAGSYGAYIMPGMLIIILQQTLLVGIGLVGGAKKEKMDSGMLAVNQKIKTGLYSVVFGRSLAYFVIYVFNIVFTLILLSHWFGFPDKGEFITSAVLVIPFIFSTIFMGLSISQLFKRREHSIMFLVFLSPLVLFLTGMSWPSEVIPEPLNLIAHIFPSTLMVPAYLRVRTIGAILQDVSFEYWFLMGQTLFYFLLSGLTLFIKRSRMEKKEIEQLA